jgi:F0F1-type ATP synthase membrane subunit c/vacuolar-type H+-ATPase subunit K
MKRVIYWLAIFLTVGLFAASTALAAQGQGEAGAKAASKQRKAAAQPSRVLGAADHVEVKSS